MKQDITVTTSNWRQIQDHIHTKCMEKMEIEKQSLTEALFLALATGGEVGEMQNIVKKMWRDGVSEDLFEKFRMELADILIYLDHLLNAFGFQASELIVEKVQVNIKRPEFQQYLEGLKLETIQ